MHAPTDPVPLIRGEAVYAHTPDGAKSIRHRRLPNAQATGWADPPRMRCGFAPRHGYAWHHWQCELPYSPCTACEHLARMDRDNGGIP